MREGLELEAREGRKGLWAGSGTGATVGMAEEVGGSGGGIDKRRIALKPIAGFWGGAKIHRAILTTFWRPAQAFGALGVAELVSP